MTSSEFRTEARNKLSGKWGKAALITLAYAFISWSISFTLNLISGSLASLGRLVLEIPLSFGLVKSYVKLYNGENVEVFDFLNLGFGSFGKSWGITFCMWGKLIVPLILLIVSIIMTSIGTVGLVSNYYMSTYYSSSSSSLSGLSVVGIIGIILLVISAIWYTVKSYYYQLSFIIAAEDENIASKDAVNKSRELMDGKRGKLFVLQLSFIGWAILAVFTLYIGYLWLIPYMQFATIAFYKFALGNDVKPAVQEPVEESAEIEE